MTSKPALHGLYGITDEVLLPDTRRLLQATAAAFRGGMNLLQYRAKCLHWKERLHQASALRQLADDHHAIFIINDDVALAKAIAADGVHVGRDDAAIETARNQLGANAIIGVSCYNQLALALQAQQQGADYVALGRFFPSKTKPEAVLAEVELLSQVKRRLDIPVCAIGGITTRNAIDLLAQGVDMIAVVHDLFAAADVARQSRRFQQLFGSQ